MTKIQNLNKTSIDSLKIHLPIEKVKIINPLITDPKYIISGNTGEIISDDISQKSLTIKETGITTKFAIQEIAYFQNKTRTKNIVIQFNSKLLEQQYFEGITKETVRKIYDKLINMKIIEFSFMDFLRSKFTDADVKKDFIQDTESYLSEIAWLNTLSIPKSNRNSGVCKYKLGIEWSQRANKDFISSPYLKIYSKFDELNKNSKEFMTNFLMEIITENKEEHKRRRVEGTIKNGKHFKLITGRNNRLIDLLQSIDKQPEIVFINHFNKTFKLLKNEKQKISDIGYNERMLLNLLKQMQSDKYYDFQLTDICTKNHKSKSDKLKAKQKVNKLLSSQELNKTEPQKRFVSVFSSWLEYCK